jgi:hypothetical protein
MDDGGADDTEGDDTLRVMTVPDDTTTEKIREDKNGEEKGIKKPPTVSGVVPTYGRRLFTSIYTQRVIIIFCEARAQKERFWNNRLNSRSF